MSRKVTVTYTVTYDLRKGDVGRDYVEWLDGYRANKGLRSWFVIDRFVGHDNLQLFDLKAKLRITEEK